ncbi:hypothetical protein BN1708_018557, partial [Verticillium longisporum]
GPHRRHRWHRSQQD